MASNRRVVNRVVSATPSADSMLKGEIVINNLAGRETLYIINSNGSVATIQTGGGEGGNANSVLFIPQTLTEEEQAQVRENISAAPIGDDGKVPSDYLPLSLIDGITLGETADSAYAGNKGKANADAIAELQTKLSNDETILNLLIGTDTGMTIRQIAVNELANQLLSGKADADFKTLQELANWLEDHPETVAEINSNISALSGDVETNAKNIEALSGDVETIITDVDGINDTIDSLSGSIETISNTVNTITASTEETSATIETLTSENNALKEQVAALQEAIDNAIKIEMPMTQAEYDALEKADKTLYIIKEESGD